MTLESIFTPAQESVLTAVALGGAALDAMRQAGIDEDTIAAWLRDKEFCDALAQARIRKQLLYADQAEALAGEALARLRVLMSDPEATRSLNLRATLKVLDCALRFLDPHTSALVVPDPPPNTGIQHQNPRSDRKNHHSSTAGTVETMPKTAPPPTPIRVVKIGRNQPCPCGSGRKYKYCCLNSPAASLSGEVPDPGVSPAAEPGPPSTPRLAG